MREAWERLWQHPVPLVSPLLLAGLFSLSAFHVAHGTKKGLLHGAAFVIATVVSIAASYFAVVVTSRTLFDVTKTMRISEEGVMREVLRMQDLASVMWLLLRRGLVLTLYGVPVWVVADLVLKVALRSVMHAEHDKLAIRIALYSWLIIQSMLMGRYGFAIPMMVLGEKNAKVAMSLSRDAVRSMGWRLEGLAGCEFVLLMLPTLLLQATGHATSVDYGGTWPVALAVAFYHAFAGAWFVVGLSMMARDLSKTRIVLLGPR